MYQIRSTYDEWAPEYDTYPDGRQWPGHYETYAGAWAAVRDYLFSQRWAIQPSQEAPDGLGLAPYGHEQATTWPGQHTIQNDAETIEIHAV
ncbi:hypothetical protein [Hymenobacter sp. UYP22]|uniref:hypothetical protein n=1 Tax=Hymenobacter sp. UYP22 TaxID=3156348 RepID=UPI003393B423